MTLRLALTSKFWIVSTVGLILLITSCKSKHKTEMPESKDEKIETGVYLKKVYQSGDGNLNYRILYPNGFEPTKKYPVLLFLHGSGERGDDNEAQLVHGSELIKAGMDIHQSIAIFPQCPADDYWVNLKEVLESTDGKREFLIDVAGPPSNALSLVMELMNSIKEKEYINRSKIYVTGLSMGGMATFDLLWRMPNTFAAAAAICGAGSTEKASVFANLPMRIYHGEVDQVVPVEESKKMIKALQDAGGNPEVFLYPDVNHNSWDNAFAEEDFLSWFYGNGKL